MAGIELRGGKKAGVTVVSNVFIDCYMALANGEYVKVYLYLLRTLANGGADFSISRTADFFEHTEKDIIRALNYWQKEGLLKLEHEQSGQIKAIELLEIASGKNQPEPAATSDKQAVAGQAVTTDRKPGASAGSVNYNKDMTGLKGDADFTQLLYITQKYLERPLTYTDTKILAYLYDDLKFSLELLEYLIEECVSARHTSMHYIESIAISWHKNDITTIDAARTYSSFQRKECYEVMKAFGIKHRVLATIEKRLVYKWLFELNFPMAIILEACDRTVLATNEGNFAYADEILVKWHQNGVKRKEDIEALDLKFKSGKKSKQNPRNTGRNGNKFHNFEQRGYDYDALLKKQQ